MIETLVNSARQTNYFPTNRHKCRFPKVKEKDYSQDILLKLKKQVQVHTITNLTQNI